MSLPSREKQRRIIWHAARKWGIKPSILWGVYGTETGFGSNVSSSSAGAVGPFQFLPSTAAGMGVNPYDFHSAAYGAAKYLSQYKGRGTAGMLSAYNAGPAGGIVPTYVSTTLQNAKSWGKAPSGARGGGGSSGGSRGPNPNQNVFDVGRRALPTPGGAGIVGLLNQTQTSPQPNVTAPLPEPATSARSALKMPAGYQTPGSSSSPAPKSGDSLSATLSAVASLGGVSVAHTPSSVRQGVRGAEKGSQGASHGGTSGNTKVATMLHIAKKFDHARTTYLWGGGHSAFAHSSDRVDCSGYVSAILHAAGLLSSPMTSGGLMSWGKPGRGKYVTVYANTGHVLIEINGRFFATSSENPGGGPGERSRPSASYLASFTARHPALP